MTTLAYSLPAGISRADDIVAVVDGVIPAIGSTPVCDYLVCASDGPVAVEIAGTHGITQAVIRPASAGVISECRNGRLYLQLKSPRQISVEIPGRQPLYLFIQPLTTAEPAADARSVRRLAAGQIHELGEVVLTDGECLHI